MKPTRAALACMAAFAAASASLASAGEIAMAAAVPPAGYATTYEYSAQGQITWLTCGYGAGSSGCYGSGSLGPFQRACAVAGSDGMVYVADADAPGSAGRSATIYAYREIASATPSVTLRRKVTLPLAGSASANCSMAILGNLLYFGTDQSGSFYTVDRQTFAVLPRSICGTPITSISAGRDLVIVNESNCLGWFTRPGDLVISGGQFGTTFVPSQNGFTPMR